MTDHRRSAPGKRSGVVRPASDRPAFLRVAAVQSNAGATLEENLLRMEQAAVTARRRGADVVLFPECVTTGYGYDFARLDSGTIRSCLREVGELAARLRLNLLVGSPVSDGQKWYNGLTVFDRAGRLVHVYAKCQLTDSDRRWFAPGNSLSLFSVEGVPCTAILCHERRYPELVRLPVMAGARMVFHPNAGMDALAVSKAKRGGRDGIAVRAFENAVPYVFANTVGPQGQGKWSAGDSKIVGAEGSVLRLADNRSETVLVARVDLTRATGKYAQDSLQHPRFLAPYWRAILRDLKRRVKATDRRFAKWFRDG